MPAFRPSGPRSRLTAPPGQDALRDLIQELTRPTHFFIAPPCDLAWEHVREEASWELFRGNLLDHAHTRLRQTFESWNAYWHEGGARSAEPLLSVKVDWSGAALHVVRAVHAYVWEGYHAGDNVVLSRERQKWVRELVGSIRLGQLTDVEDLRDELICLLFQAVVGRSRLPLTSVEAPLPAFTLGQLTYCYRRAAGADAGPVCSASELLRTGLRAELAWVEKVKLLEAALRATPQSELIELVDGWAVSWTGLGYGSTDLVALLRTLFNEISLSPYTDLVAKVLSFVDLLEKHEQVSFASATDFLAHVLRQIGRHLTAYDLITFHHRGANYPDALLLDEVLKAYLGRIERAPNHFLSSEGDSEEVAQRKRLRRRALRQGWLLRTRYEGHPVPDAPTSQGEHVRVMPAAHPRVAEEQIVNPARRAKQLYAGDGLDTHLGEYSRAALQQSVADLEHAQELRELGTALFLDRPLGIAKHPGEPDHTQLFSYVAFSRSLAQRHLQELARRLPLFDPARHLQALGEASSIGGVPLRELGGASRPVPVALEDARQVAEDFVFLHTTATTTAQFFACFEFTPLRERYPLPVSTDSAKLLIVRAGRAGMLRIYDGSGTACMELEVDATRGYTSRAGIEYPTAGLRVVRVGNVVLGANAVQILPATS